MSADDGKQPRRKRTRTQTPRATRKTRSASQPSAGCSKRITRKNITHNSEKDELMSGKDDGTSGSQATTSDDSKGVKSGLPESTEIFIPPKYCNKITQSHHVVNYVSSVTRTSMPRQNTSQLLHGPLISSWSNLVPRSKAYGVSILSPFKRRVTALACHSTNPYLVVAASKGGELALYNLKNPAEAKFIEGIGANGSVVAMKFHPEKPTSVYTASITGRITCQDFCGVYDHILLDCRIWSNWFCSLDVQPEKKLLVAGDCVGYLSLAADNGEKLLLKREVHRTKVTHAEFCRKIPHLLVTSSTDHTVKLWDIRMFSGDSRVHPLHTLVHNKGINSAYFSPSNSSLLTTDQYNELRVYSSPWWDLEVTIFHPHRQFQHLTPIKASWHPLVDAVVVGRYPEKDSVSDQQTIDFFDGHTGEELYRLQSEELKGIASLNCFNYTGDVLVSGFGYRIVFWHNKEEYEDCRKLSSLGGGQSAAESQSAPKRGKKKSKNLSKRVQKKLSSNS